MPQTLKGCRVLLLPDSSPLLLPIVVTEVKAGTKVYHNKIVIILGIIEDGTQDDEVNRSSLIEQVLEGVLDSEDVV